MIRVDMFQAQLLEEKIRKSCVLDARGLLEAVLGFQKFAHHIAICFDLYAFENLYVDELVDEDVQEDSFDVHLVYIQVKKGCYCKENSKSHGFYYNCKGLIKINSKLLEIAFDNPSSFKTSNIPVYVALYFVYPLIS